MATVDSGVDALQLFLTGGASNKNPNSSLGGAASSIRFRGLGAITGDEGNVSSPHLVPVAGLRVDNVYPAVGTGQGVFQLDASGNLTFTPPGATVGASVTLSAGGSAIATGSDGSKAARVFRESGLPWPSGAKITFELVELMNGVLGMKNVTNAQRVAGATTYRAFMLKNAASLGVDSIRLWLPTVSGRQSTYSIGVEYPAASTIQTIADETTAPTAVAWHTPLTEASALMISGITPGKHVGVWVRRVFPAAGTVNAWEKTKLAMSYYAR